MEQNETLTPEEIARRRDDAIRRALNTPKPAKPAKPQRATPSTKGTRAKRRAGRARKT